MPVDDFTRYYDRFSRDTPDLFSATGGFMEAEHWLMAVCDKFELHRIPRVHWTELSVTTFRGEAKVWWQRQRIRFRGGHPIPWEWFETSFRDQYMGQIQLAGFVGNSSN